MNRFVVGYDAAQCDAVMYNPKSISVGEVGVRSNHQVAGIVQYEGIGNTSRLPVIHSAISRWRTSSAHL